MRRKLFDYSYATASNDLILIVKDVDEATKIIEVGELYNLYQPDLAGYVTTATLSAALYSVTSSIVNLSDEIEVTNTYLSGATASIRQNQLDIIGLTNSVYALSATVSYNNSLLNTRINTTNINVASATASIRQNQLDISGLSNSVSDLNNETVKYFDVSSDERQNYNISLITPDITVGRQAWTGITIQFDGSFVTFPANSNYEFSVTVDFGEGPLIDCYSVVLSMVDRIMLEGEPLYDILFLGVTQQLGGQLTIGLRNIGATVSSGDLTFSFTSNIL